MRQIHLVGATSLSMAVLRDELPPGGYNICVRAEATATANPSVTVVSEPTEEVAISIEVRLAFMYVHELCMMCMMITIVMSSRFAG